MGAAGAAAVATATRAAKRVKTPSKTPSKTTGRTIRTIGNEGSLAKALPPVEIDPVAAARSAGLRHVDDRRPGLRREATGRRIRQGRRFVPELTVVDANGRRVRDAATLERVRKLAIPPAWQDVWICPSPDGHIQATGRDARGRKQYRYHPRWREERDATKYSMMIAFGRALPRLRRQVETDLRLPGLPRRKVLATVVRLLETTFIRVGNEEYARTNRSFGLTTLKDHHVRIGKDKVRFHFRGKSGIFHDISVNDAAIARIVRRCRDLPGQELFQYVDDDGHPQTIDSADVNEYIREATGQAFTAKHFRTWAGTVLAAVALQEIAATEEHHDARASSRRRTNSQIVSAVREVAERLGNTVSVCRKCYVHPDVIASFMDGSLAEAFSRQITALRESPRVRGLRNEENLVLGLLRQRLRETRRESRGRAGSTALARQLRRSLRCEPRPRRSTGHARDSARGARSRTR